MKKKTEANLYMIVSKVFSGLNVNALKYLLPVWLSPLTGATFRCCFAAVAFWVIAWFMKPEHPSGRVKRDMVLLGTFGLYGFLFLYLIGLSKTTPVSSSIFGSLQPIWVFLLMVVFYKERITRMKVIGILMGLAGALLCILTQKSDDLASDAFTGNMFCLGSSLLYAVYLVLSKRFLRDVSPVTLLKYAFSGAAVASLVVLPFEGFKAPLFSEPFHWWPFAVLMFVLIFPTVISYLLVPIGLKYLTTTVVAIYGYLVLIVSAVVSFLVGQDRFSWTQLIAIVLICASVYFVEVAESRDQNGGPSPVPNPKETGGKDAVKHA